jgi:glycerol-3-phosphate dehydrogenase
LREIFVKAFEYSDCRVDDSRLVILNARDAADRGAAIFTRTEVLSARVEMGVWRIRLRDAASGGETEVSARLLVNAAGPWADAVSRQLASAQNPRLRLVRGSHIVVPKLFEGDGAYLFQNPDGRVVFAIAWQEDFTLIGATDVEHSGAPDAVAITQPEMDYLLRASNAHFRRNIGPADVVWSFSGLRPLFDDHAATASRVTREHVVETLEPDGAPLINLFGGKITAYRRLAEEVLRRVGGLIGVRGAPWTARAPLPGGNFPGGDFNAFVQDLRARKPFLDAALARRLAGAYGTQCLHFLGAARESSDLGEEFGGGLTRAEVDYLVAREWARTAEDILWRRSKLGLRLSREAAEKLAACLGERGATALKEGAQ